MPNTSHLREREREREMARNLSASIPPFQTSPFILSNKNRGRLPNTLLRSKCRETQCCSSHKQRKAIKADYYNLLGVAVDAPSQQIRQAYRKLQKRYHPDITGEKGHEFTLLLNEAYQVLMRDDLRRRYDASTGKGFTGIGNDFSGYSSSKWNGPLRPHALFVDENACTGCRECVHHTNNTFMMDDTVGRARVKIQFGDTDTQIEVSIDSCPVSCIHWVDPEDLPILEFFVKPQQKESYGVFGGGWERPRDVFMAAKNFKKACKQSQQKEYDQDSFVEESPAQMKARRNAGIMMQMEKFLNLWSYLRKLTNFS